MTTPRATEAEIATLFDEIAVLEAQLKSCRERVDRARKLRKIGHAGITTDTEQELQAAADRATLKLIAARLSLHAATKASPWEALWRIFADLPIELRTGPHAPEPLPMTSAKATPLDLLMDPAYHPPARSTPSEPHEVSEPFRPGKPSKELAAALDHLVDHMWAHENIDTEMVQGATFDELRGNHVLAALTVVEWHIRPLGMANFERLFVSRLADEVAMLTDTDYAQLHESVAQLRPRNKASITPEPPAQDGEWLPISAFAPTGQSFCLPLGLPCKVAGIGWQETAVFQTTTKAWFTWGAGLCDAARLEPTHFRPLRSDEPGYRAIETLNRS